MFRSAEEKLRMKSKPLLKSDAVKGLYARCLVEEIDQVNKAGTVGTLARQYEKVPPDFAVEETGTPNTRGWRRPLS